MKSAIVFSMIVLGLVGYLNLGQMIEADPWEGINARSTTIQYEAIDANGMDQPPEGPDLGGDGKNGPDRPNPQMD
ncbi:MAG: hypothetical protein WBF13_02885 [Candidatus Zixiibacteriota bacterium]